MKADTAKPHFGEFLRQAVMRRGHGQIAPIIAAAGLSKSTAYRFFDSDAPEPLRIDYVNKMAAAKAAGFETWDQLDAAWRTTPVVATGRRIAHLSLSTILAASRELEHHEQVLLVVSLGESVLNEGLKTIKASGSPMKIGPGTGPHPKDSPGRRPKADAARTDPDHRPKPPRPAKG